MAEDFNIKAFTTVKRRFALAGDRHSSRDQRPRRVSRAEVAEAMGLPSFASSFKRHYDSNFEIVGTRLVEIAGAGKVGDYTEGYATLRVWDQLGFTNMVDMYSLTKKTGNFSITAAEGMKYKTDPINVIIIWDVASVVSLIAPEDHSGLFKVPSEVIMVPALRTILPRDTLAKMADMLAVMHRGFRIEACRLIVKEGETQAMVMTSFRLANVAMALLSAEERWLPITINLGLSASIMENKDLVRKLEIHIEENALMAFADGEFPERLVVDTLIDSTFVSDNPLFEGDRASLSPLPMV